MIGALFEPMGRSIGVAVGVGSILVAAWNCMACGSSSQPSTVNGAAGAAPSSSAGTPGSSSGGNGALAFGGGSNSSAGTGTGPGQNDTCAADVSTAQELPLDIYLMLDESGSMLDQTATGGTKWDAVKAAVEAFLKDKASAGLGVGLQYFPLEKQNVPASCTTNAECGDSGPCFLKACSHLSQLLPCEAASDCVLNGSNYGPCATLGQCSLNADYVCLNEGNPCGVDDKGNDLGDCGHLTSSVCTNTVSCSVAQYAAPAAPIATLPGAAATLLASIDAQMPAGNTPTAPALAGAIQQASAWAAKHPDHRVVAVLATDGLPTSCAPTDIASVAALAQAGVAASPSINTFVIGVFGPNDPAQAPANLNEIARGGGTKSAFIVDTQKDVTTQFVAALDAIRGARLACEFQIPEPGNSQTLNYHFVNVQFTTGGKPSDVFYVKDAAGCDPVTGGWHYDVDPDGAVAPTKIVACPATCTTFQAAGNGSTVGIALGCQTVVK